MLCNSGDKSGEDPPDLTLEDLILDKRKWPLTQENFRDYLDKRYALENFDFLLAVHTCQQIENPEEKRKMLDEIVAKYIRDESENAVNISSDMRKSILNNFEGSSTSDECVQLLKPAEEEVTTMILSGLMLQDFTSENLKNINFSGRVIRLISSLVILALTIIFSVFAILNDWHRAIRVVVLPFYAISVSGLLHAKSSF